MRDRRQANRRVRRDRRWSDDRRTDEVLRLYAAIGGATVLALRRLPHELREGLAEGITAPDRRRGTDRRTGRRRSIYDRRQLDDPGFVGIALDPSERVRAPHEWREGDFQELCAAITSDTEVLAQLQPPESWSRERDYLFRTVRGWSQTVARLSRAVLRMLENGDMATALSLMETLRERTADLCLLQSYPEGDRSDAAMRALLFQALSQAERHPERRRSALLEQTLKDLKGRVDRRTYVEVERLARDPTSHWSSLGRRFLAEQTPAVTEDRLSEAGLLGADPGESDLHELDIVTVAPNVKDYRPRNHATPDRTSAVALQAWDWVLASTSAVRVLFGVGRPAPVY